jgi:hypothetical protein
MRERARKRAKNRADGAPLDGAVFDRSRTDSKHDFDFVFYQSNS